MAESPGVGYSAFQWHHRTFGTLVTAFVEKLDSELLRVLAEFRKNEKANVQQVIFVSARSSAG